MEPDLKTELNIIKKELEEHGEILRYLKRKSRWSGIFSTIKWIVYLGIFFGLWYLLAPILDKAIEFYQDFQKNVGEIEEFKEKNGLQLEQFFEKLKP